MTIRLWAWCFIVLLAFPTLGATSRTASGADRPARCTQLESASFSKLMDAPTQITAALPMTLGNDPDAFCLVEGYVSPSVGFKLGLPASWNGRFLEVGCGGHCGVLTDNELFSSQSLCAAALRKGYACIESDMGHKGTVADTLWAHNNLQAKIDWGYRATHVVAIAGKAITEHYYRKAPRKSYFFGGSTGGRQALQAAQIFPSDFDGIVALAPPVDLAAIYITFAWGFQALHDENGVALVGRKELALLTRAAVEKCDLDDRLRDAVIGDPLRCDFDPAEIGCTVRRTEGCLSQAQIDAVRKIYSGPLNSKGERISLGGPAVGSELGDWDRNPRAGWKFAYLGGFDGTFSGYTSLAADGLRTLFFWPELPATWKLGDFDFDRDSRRMATMQALYDSSNPDLRRFKAAGGKLIVAQGLNDNAVLPRQTIDYYETVERTMGGRSETQSFFRLFLLPGVAHCSTGPGADTVDYLSAIEAWVERGQAPDRLIAAHLNDPDALIEFPLPAARIRFTRPVYPYPIRAQYLGRGDPDDAANFGPAGH